MAKTANVLTRIWLDQYDLSGFLNAHEQDVRQDLPLVTCFSDTGPRRIVANYDHVHRLAGFFDGDDDQIDEIIDALRESTSDHYLGYLPGANAAASLAYESVVRTSEEPRSSRQAAATLLNATLDGSNGLSRSVVLLNGTISANGNQTGQNLGASTAGQVFQAVIRVPSGTFTSFTVKLQESQNDGGADPYADIATISQAVVAAGVWRLTTTAATEAWKRVVIADWIGTNAVVRVTGGIVAGT